jgi:hypothetical protein
MKFIERSGGGGDGWNNISTMNFSIISPVSIPYFSNILLGKYLKSMKGKF